MSMTMFVVKMEEGKEVGSHKWKTYKEAYEDILQTGFALQAHCIEHGARIGIYGANCLQWMVSVEQEEKDKAVDMNIKPYSWNEFPNMSKENPSEPSPPQPLDMYNHVY
ncbi:Long chain acyl-CoA synthetase 1 [Capsicum baccatum]|uniref:Long chain acyl-CoA synthetase 1 n=1 Tax=Capsicum baccatum TaxID=33114 RepID=A0A2G2WDP8_CAPBA|nr:Long chain acyl-CoA synthetase 1 [Capsicum baccatum]